MPWPKPSSSVTASPSSFASQIYNSLKIMTTMTQTEFLAECQRRFGPDAKKWKFICPACGTIQSVGQLKDAVIASGGTKEDVHGYIAFSCIGRFTKQGDAGIAAKNRGEKWDQGCNWTLGGLFQIHTFEVIMENGHHRPTFEIAAADPALKS